MVYYEKVKKRKNGRTKKVAQISHSF